MRIAIVHDYLKEYGGAERVLEELLRIFPQAEVFTTLYAPEYLGPHKKRFEDYKIHTSWFQKLPYKHKIISPLRILSPLAFKNLDLKGFDIIIVSQTGAFFPNFVKKTKSQKLICYTHTPPRYLYGYKTARDLPKGIFGKIATGVAFNALRIVDVESSKNVDQFIANSNEVKARIEKFYRRDAIVIYPPVAIPSVVSTDSKLQSSNYYLAGGRFARAKGTDIIIRAFNKNGLPLRLFGRGFAGFEEELKEMAKNNIEFVGEVTDEEKFELMAGAKAFIFSAFDEDFGITPVESMGVGTPVVAFSSGGVKETVIEGKTGVFYEPNTPDAINAAISKLRTTKIHEDDCVRQAEKFSEKVFDKKISELINSVYDKK